MPEQFARTELILGPEAMDRLRRSRVAVFGIGGVGGYVVEALARSGVGSLDIIDHDKVSMTNINRQIIASTNTVGRDKVDVMKERILSINPDAVVNVSKSFFLPETADLFDFGKYTYVVDAAAAAFWLLLRGEGGSAMNIADSASEIRLRDLARLLAAEAGTQVVFELPEAVERAGYSTATKAVLDSSRIEQLGWKAFTPIAQGLPITVHSPVMTASRRPVLRRRW